MYWDRGIELKGTEEFSTYFQQVDTDSMLPVLDHSTNNYGCKDCSQKWYFELSPEESPWPIFALKDSTGALTPRSNVVEAQKQFLRILAHRGFSTDACLWRNCEALALNGMFVCPKHAG
jgi:hypothetical protein